LPALEELYRVRVRFQEIFDTAPDRHQAGRWLEDLELEALEAGVTRQ
jgi:hypothetical protein